MLKGFYMTLMVGPVIPVPVPQSVLDALTSVTVRTSAEPGVASGFDLVFTLSNNSPLHTIFLLAGGSLPPVMRVIIVVTVNGTPEVLMDGVITEQKVAPGAEAGHSTLTIRGVDLTAVMNLIPFDGFPFPAMPVAARVALIILKYAMFGIIPLVIPPILVDVPIPVEGIPRQQGTDLEYINQLAHEVGYIFYITPGPVPGTNKAYFGPEIKVGVPQPALNINMDAHTNVEDLSFNFNSEKTTMPIVYIYIKAAKLSIPIPIPNVSLLNPPLGLIPPLPKRFEQLTDVAKLSPIQAALRGLSKASRSSDAVTGHGSLNVMRYGRILKARALVGVRGAGLAFDGLHFVTSVTHTLKRGEFKQSFTLARNGLISTLPKVPA
jgi:hypothetical protein